MVKARSAEDGSSRAKAEARLVELMDRYQCRVYGYILALVHDPDLAEDCTQDTFVRAYSLLLQGREVNKQWLYMVARCRAIDDFRRRRRVRPDEAALANVAVAGPTDERAAVLEVLERLSDADRTVLCLSVLAGFTCEEIGAMKGCSGATVRQRLARARVRFRAAYGAAA